MTLRWMIHVNCARSSGEYPPEYSTFTALKIVDLPDSPAPRSISFFLLRALIAASDARFFSVRSLISASDSGAESKQSTIARPKDQQTRRSLANRAQARVPCDLARAADGFAALGAKLR